MKNPAFFNPPSPASPKKASLCFFSITSVQPTEVALSWPVWTLEKPVDLHRICHLCGGFLESGYPKNGWFIFLWKNFDENRWWLGYKGLYCPIVIGDCKNPRTGNPYKPGFNGIIEGFWTLLICFAARIVTFLFWLKLGGFPQSNFGIPIQHYLACYWSRQNPPKWSRWPSHHSRLDHSALQCDIYIYIYTYVCVYTRALF